MTDVGDGTQGVADLSYRWFDEPTRPSRADEPVSGEQSGCTSLVLVEYARGWAGNYVDGCRYGHFL